MDFSWIDILLAAVLILFAVRGLIQGFIKTFLSFAAVLASLILAKIFSGRLAAYVKTNFGLYNTLEETINKKMMSVFTGKVTEQAVTDSNELYNIPESLQRFIGNLVNESNNTVGSATEAFAANAAAIILNVLCFLVIFLLVLLVGKLLVLIFDKLAKLPVLNAANKLGGLACGLIVGIVVCVIISTLLYYCNVLLRADGLSTAINNSFLIRYFYISFLFG